MEKADAGPKSENFKWEYTPTHYSRELNNGTMTLDQIEIQIFRNHVVATKTGDDNLKLELNQLTMLKSYLTQLLTTVQIPWWERFCNFKNFGEARQNWQNTLSMVISFILKIKVQLALEKQRDT